MEHVTEGLYMAAAAGLFALAVSLLPVAGRAVDGMFAAEQTVCMPGGLLWERVQISAADDGTREQAQISAVDDGMWEEAGDE